MAGLASCDWIRQSLNLCITGPTGCGKTWLACAWVTRPAGRASRFVTCGYRACSNNCASLMAMVAMPD